MTLQTDLQSLVQKYARFDAEKKRYVTIVEQQKPKEAGESKTSLTLFQQAQADNVHKYIPEKLSKTQLLEIDGYFIKILNKHLLIGEPDKENIKKNYRAISLTFHTDKIAFYSPEMIWLEDNLSEGANNGACFKCLFSCYEKLITPQKFKDKDFTKMNTLEEWRQWLRSLRANAQTFTAKCFCDSLIALFDDSFSFFDDVGRIKPAGLKLLITFVPMIFSTYGAILFLDELCAVYALSVFLLRGGQFLEGVDSVEISSFGKAIENVGIMTTLATSTILARFVEMTFWTTHQCFNLSLSIGNSLLKPILASANKTAPHTNFYSKDEFGKNLLLASQDLSKGEGMQFKNPELKVIAAPLESYLGLNAQQFLVNLRVGNLKKQTIKAFLFRLSVLDQMSGTIERKLNEAQEELEIVKNNKVVYNSVTKDAVDGAFKAIVLLKTTKEEPAGLLEYKCEINR